jgi:N-formylglutamate deformylase
VYSLYLADPDRPAEGGPDGTGPCPTETADGRAIYLPGKAPAEDEQRSRRRDTWQAFHLGLAQLMLQAKDAHSVVALLDVQTRREAEADLRLASRGDGSCASGLRTAVAEAARPAEADGYRLALDGAGSGGFIARSYGRPDEGTHVLQLVLARRTFLDADDRYDPDAAARLRPHLERMVAAARTWAEEQASG